MPQNTPPQRIEDFHLPDAEGTPQHILQLDGELRTLFMPQGFFDLRILDAVPDPPPIYRTRIAFVNDELVLVDPTGGTVIFAPADVDEAILTFPDTVAPGTAINIQDGTYGGGGPATVEGDTLTLPATGAAFKADGRWLAFLNGQAQKRGASLADETVNWASSTQVSLALRILPGNELTLRKVK